MMNKVLFRCKFQVPKHISKKNQKKIAFNRRTNKSFIMTESKAAFIEKYVVNKLITERIKQRIDTIKSDIQVSFILTYPESVYLTKKSTRSNKVLDLSNSVQIYEDALEKAMIIENDRNICSLDGSKRIHHKEITYLVEIVIYSLESA